MSAVKSGLIGAAAVGGVIAVLFASGTVKLSGSEGAETSEQASDDSRDDGEVAKTRKGRKKRGRKGRRRRKKGGGDLESLGYIGAVEISEADKGKSGTTIHDASRAHQGLSLYTPCAWGRKYRRASGGKVMREARLIDNAGEVVHAWTTDFVPNRRRGWAMAKLDAEGNLYAVNARSGLVKVDWDSNTLWSVKKGFHHDFNFGPDGKIYALIEHGRQINFDGQRFNLLDNGVVILGPDGEVEDKFSFYDVLRELPELQEHIRRRLKRNAPRGGLAHDEDEDGFDEEEGRILFGRDMFHANTLNFATKTIDGVWNEGDIITSIREMNLVVVLDKDTHEPKWHWGQRELMRQHDPEQLDNGNLLVFDNGRGRHWSRVVEFDPVASEIVWEYKHDDFFSGIRGLSQRLPNGGTLIVSSQRGRAFEVTTDGEIVWEYWSPDVLGGSLRVPFRMERLEGEALAFAQKKLAEGKGNPAGASKFDAAAKPSADTTDEGAEAPDGDAKAPEEADAPAPEGEGAEASETPKAVEGEPAAKAE